MHTKFESYNKSIIAFFWGSDNTGVYSVLGLCIVPPYGRANLRTEYSPVLHSQSCNNMHAMI